MRRRVRDQRRQQRGIQHQHGAGDPRHAAGHDQKEFAAGELCQIGADEQGRLDHAEEDVGGGGKAHRAADAERAFQNPRHAAHDRRQYPPVEQQRGQHAHHQDDRQGLKRQDEIRTGRLEIEGQRAAAEIAEHEGGAGAGRGRNGVDGVVDGAEGAGHQRQFDQHQCGDESDRKSDRGLPQRHRAAVFAERPRHRQQRQHAERRLQLQHDSQTPSGDYDSGGLASAMPGSPSLAAIDKQAGVGHGVRTIIAAERATAHASISRKPAHPCLP